MNWRSMKWILIFYLLCGFSVSAEEALTTPSAPAPAPIESSNTIAAPENLLVSDAPQVIGEFELVKMFEDTLLKVDSDPTILCSSIRELDQNFRQHFTTTSNNLNIKQNMQIYNQIFKLKQKVIQNQDIKSDCDNIHEKMFYFLYSLEEYITTSLSGIGQLTVRHWEAQLKYEQDLFFKSRYFKGAIDHFEHGDIILTSNLVFKFDMSRALTKFDTITSHASTIHIDKNSKRISVITVENGKGLIILDFDTFLRENNYLVTIIRAKDVEAGKAAADFLYDMVTKSNEKQKLALFDDQFNFTDTKRYYCSELIYHSYVNSGDNSLTPPLLTAVNLSPNTLTSAYLQRQQANIYFPKNFLFTKKFDLVGEWTFYPATRLNKLSYFLARALTNLATKHLNIERNYKNKILGFLWPYRENEIVKKIFIKLGFPAEALIQTKLDVTLYGPNRMAVVRTCYLKLMERDFTSFFKGKYVWTSEENAAEIGTECFIEEFKKLKPSI